MVTFPSASAAAGAAASTSPDVNAASRPDTAADGTPILYLGRNKQPQARDATPAARAASSRVSQDDVIVMDDDKADDVSVLTTKTHDELLTLYLQERKKNRPSSGVSGLHPKKSHESGTGASPTPAGERGSNATTAAESQVGSPSTRDESSDASVSRSG